MVFPGLLLRLGKTAFFIPGMPMEEDQKIRIGGIKFSEELVQITVTSQIADQPKGSHLPDGTAPSDISSTAPPVFPLLQQIAKKHINVTFLCHSKVIQSIETVFCVEVGDIDAVRKLIKASPFQGDDIDLTSSVGTITFFPHRNEFSLMGRILQFFGANDFPVHSLSTSISAIALNTDYILLDAIALKIQNVLSLPDNHAPFRQGFKITQIQL